MHPSGQNLHIEGSNVPWIDDAFIEEYPQTPEPDHHDGLQRESYQVETGEELASRVGWFLFVENDGEQEVRNDQGLWDVGELAKVENIFVVLQDVEGVEDGVEEEQAVQILVRLSKYHGSFYFFN